MISIDAMVGNESARATIRRVLETGRLPHALLFHGPEGVGKATLARAFAALLLCKDDRPEPCGACDGCRLVERDSHPDLLGVGLLTRDEKTPDDKRQLHTRKTDAVEGDLRGEILVDQIRTLNRLAGFASRAGGRRVFLIDPADRMNVESQNALLKTLEEPPPASLLLLVASRPHLLLPTVRSRCFALGFSELRVDELRDLLVRQGVPEEEAGPRAALAEGRVGRALTLDLESMRARRDEMLQALGSLVEGDGTARLSTMAASLAGKDSWSFIEGIDLLSGLLRDAARASVGGERSGLRNVDLERELEGLGRRIGPDRAAALVRSADRLRSRLRINANRVLMAESLLAAVAGGPLP